MKIIETKLSGSYIINSDLREDERGFFARLFCEKEYTTMGINSNWVQINNSLSKDTGTLRGLHFQKNPHCEVKLVRCISGAIWDVIVDIRVGSNTFGKWFGAELTAENRSMMYVPKGFAHGFISTEPNSEILYLVSDFYHPGYEQTLLWNDAEIAINWPINPVVISNKDSQGKTLKELNLSEWDTK
jgi:dTDP-4-dehydrorhamnose 3,5-epimerase